MHAVRNNLPRQQCSQPKHATRVKDTTHVVTLQGEGSDLPLRLCLVTPLKREERALSTRPAATLVLPCLSTLEARRLFLSPEAAYKKCTRRAAAQLVTDRRSDDSMMI